MRCATRGFHLLSGDIVITIGTELFENNVRVNRFPGSPAYVAPPEQSHHGNGGVGSFGSSVGLAHFAQGTRG